MSAPTDSYAESEWRRWVRGELNLGLFMTLILVAAMLLVVIVLVGRIDTLDRRLDRITTTTTSASSTQRSD